MKLCVFNYENLFLSHQLDTQGRSVEKPKEKLLSISNAIKDIDPDIILGLEVGGEESLVAFNDIYLNNSFYPSLIPGNSNRGIEIGYLIKKSFLEKYKLEHYTHKNRKIKFELTHEPTFMSRDISELRILQNDKKDPHIIILGVHLKSKWDQEGNDPEGRKRRKAEFTLLIKTYLYYQKIYPQTKIIIAGDFNGLIWKNNFEPEFEKLFETDLIDILEAIDLPEEKRTTYIFFGSKNDNFPVINTQLDYIFLSKKYHQLINPKESGIYYYKDENQVPYALPQNPFQRASLPSDHYPVVLDIKI